MADKVRIPIKIQRASPRIGLVINVATNLARYIFSLREIASLKIRCATGPDGEATPAVGTVMPRRFVIIPLDAAIAFIFCPLV